MHTFVLQDFMTIRGTNNTVTQSESEWLDLTQYEDVFFWIDCKELTGTTVTLNIQTSPTKDDTLFTSVYSQLLTTAIQNPGSTGGKCLMSSATVPIARYVRWQLTSTATPFDATLRIFLSANAPGM
jgi:hypothetical protein